MIHETYSIYYSLILRFVHCVPRIIKCQTVMKKIFLSNTFYTHSSTKTCLKV